MSTMVRTTTRSSGPDIIRLNYMMSILTSTMMRMVMTTMMTMTTAGPIKHTQDTGHHKLENDHKPIGKTTETSHITATSTTMSMRTRFHSTRILQATPAVSALPI